MNKSVERFISKTSEWYQAALTKQFATCHIQADLVICGLFICEFAYLRLQIGHFSGTYPPIYSHSWPFYMRIRYMRTKFFGPYLSHITRSNCMSNEGLNVAIVFAINSESEVIYADQGYATHLALRATLETI